MTNDGIVIGCYSEEENEKFGTIGNKKVYRLKPRIRTIGRNEKYSESQINDFIFKCNWHIFSSDADIKIGTIFPHKKIIVCFKLLFK